MATALKLKSDIKKLKSAIASKATPKTFIPKLKAQLDKAESELSAISSGAKPRKTSTTKSTKTTLTALQKLIQKKKYGVYKGAGVNLEKDAAEGAFASGRRVSKGLKSNQFGDKGDNKGNVYYEYRPNRLDVKQPKKKQTYPKLAKGGFVGKGELVWKKLSSSQKKEFLYENFTPEITPRSQETLVGKDWNFLPKNVKLKFQAKYANVEEYAKGGKIAKGGNLNSLLKEQQALELELTDIKFGSDLTTDEGVEKYRKSVAPVRAKLNEIDKQLEALGYEPYADGGEINVDDKVEEYIEKLKNGESIRRYYHVRGTSNPKFFETIMPNKSEKGSYKRYESASKGSLGTLQNEYLTEKEVTNYLKKTIVEIRKEFYKDKMAKGGSVNYGRSWTADRAKHNKSEDYEIPMNQRKFDHGGEVGKGFLIRDMREKLNRMFPDTFGFTVGNVSKEGNKTLNSAALIVDLNDPYRGLEDKDIESKLFFPQYKRDHNINFRVMQGGENTYFYFALESEKGDEYIGQFGFKDQGDVSSDYVTRFIAFLMEQYGLPFEVKHSVMAKGGYMAGGGEMHKADYFKDGGKVFSEKELKDILDEALSHFYQGLNQIDLAMRYLEVKGQGGLKTPLSNKLKLDDLRESVEKIDEYISK